MFSKTTTAIAFIGLASSSLVAAAPTWGSNSVDWSTSTTIVSAATSFPTEVSPDGNKFRYPLSNDFPTPSADQLKATNSAAQGTLSNNTPPANISSNGLTNLQFVAFNELFEVAFFTDLLKNVTNNVEGYTDFQGYEREYIIDALITVQAQEQLHMINANNGLKNIAKVDPIRPCEYTFPVDNFNDAIALAQKFTDVTLGTLQDIITVFAQSGDAGFVRGVAASLGNEGEQNGFYRLLQGKKPSAQPFLSASARSLAFSAINQNFVVPGSCPDLDKINLSIFEPLTLVTDVIEAKDQYITYSFQQNHMHSSTDGLKLVLINGQNKPIVSDVYNVMIHDGTVTFQAPFNQQQNLLFGLTIAVLAQGDSFANVNAVEQATVFGPALIEVL